jgi:hypothetical protein
MTNKEATEIFIKLKNIYPNSQLNENKAYILEYVDYITKLDKKRAEKALEKIKTECKFAPNIAEFNEFYASTKNKFFMSQFEGQKCKICNNIGLVPYTKTINKHVYTFMAYCECKGGEQYNIKTNERQTLSIEEVFGIEQIKNWR